MKVFAYTLAAICGLPLLVAPVSAIWRGRAFGHGRLTERGDEPIERASVLLGFALAVPILGLGLSHLFLDDLPAGVGLFAIIPAYLLLLTIHNALYNGVHWSRGRPIRMREDAALFWFHLVAFAAVSLGFYVGFVAVLIQLPVFQ